MAITDAASFYAKVAAPRQRLTFNKGFPAVQRPASCWIVTPLAGSAPSTAVAPTNLTAGALAGEPLLRDPLVAHRILRVVGRAAMPGRLWICDRLSHQGGLSGTVTTAQTTNLPTAALTRYTSGEGVIAGLEIYTGVGATVSSATASYTNQAGTAGRTTVATTFGGGNFNVANRIIPLPLAAGDTGVRAVASVTVPATTGTAGNFGVTLFKPLMSFTVQGPGSFVWDAVEHGGGNAPEVLAGACLSLHAISSVAASYGGSQDIYAELILAEDD